MLLIYHLDAGHRVWSPSNTIVQESMRRIRSNKEENCSIRLDVPSPQGGNSTTGNVAGDCFLIKDTSSNGQHHQLI